VCIDPARRKILDVQNIRSERSSNEHKIKDISDQITTYLNSKHDTKEPTRITFAIENFVMKGKGGATLQMLRGSLIGRVPYETDVVNVHNITMKSIVGGTGAADKKIVAEGVKKFFRMNAMASIQIDALIKAKEWDILDALGVGICAYLTVMGGAA
jgi:Holliday junction resolvasome RuvABC endonuclease subunit